jgi:hypothetical protein
LAVYVPTKGSRIIIRGLPENIDEIKEQVALRLQLLPGNTSRDNPLRIKETILFEVANGSAARIKRELEKTGLFKIGKTSKGASYTTIEVINLYGFANWAKAKAIREKYDLAFVKKNPHGGVHENPSERCETVGRAAQKTCETTVRASRAAMAGARGARDSWRRNPYPDTNSAGVISYNNAHPGGTPVASSSRSWDADAVRKKADAEKMYHASTWVEPGKEKDKSAYKFPHHYADGDNTLSPRGVAAAMAALMGARSERWGGPHFPDVNYESARRGIYKHLAEHYRKDLGREPPSLESVGGREPLGEKRRKRLNPHSGSQRPGHVADSLTNSQMDIMDDYNDRQIESDDPKMAYSWKELPKRLKDKVLKIKHHPDTIRDAEDYLSGLYDSQWDLVKDTHY